jgi:hypothetical protein
MGTGKRLAGAAVPSASTSGGNLRIASAIPAINPVKLSRFKSFAEVALIDKNEI